MKEAKEEILTRAVNDDVILIKKYDDKDSHPRWYERPLMLTGVYLYSLFMSMVYTALAVCIVFSLKERYHTKESYGLMAAFAGYHAIFTITATVLLFLTQWYTYKDAFTLGLFLTTFALLLIVVAYTYHGPYNFSVGLTGAMGFLGLGDALTSVTLGMILGDQYVDKRALVISGLEMVKGAAMILGPFIFDSIAKAALPYLGFFFALLAVVLFGLGVLANWLIMRAIDGPKTGSDKAFLWSRTAMQDVFDMPVKFFLRNNAVLVEIAGCISAGYTIAVVISVTIGNRLEVIGLPQAHYWQAFAAMFGGYIFVACLHFLFNLNLDRRLVIILCQPVLALSIMLTSGFQGEYDSLALTMVGLGITGAFSAAIIVPSPEKIL